MNEKNLISLILLVINRVSQKTICKTAENSLFCFAKNGKEMYQNLTYEQSHFTASVKNFLLVTFSLP